MDDKVTLWNLTTNREMTSVDFRDITISKNETIDIKFAVKNLSTKYTADNVTVRVKDVGSPNPSFTEQILFSIDESTYVEILSLGDIPPQSMSPEITMRNIARSNAIAGSFKLRIEMSDWT